ncbi:MAG: hypothetical protein MH252_07135 [Thermosynechococcaceae cyanobacterium MS004]|nr:hypothetical protein [Thermosynechococcaceae cyanobacterium MS004]
MESSTSNRFIRFTLLAASVYITIIFGAYYYNFRELPISKTDPGAWAQFGSYVGGLLSPFFSFLSFIAAIYISVILTRINEQQKENIQKSENQRRIVLELHREWNSESIYRSRTIAGKLVREYPKDKMFILESKVESDRVVHLWIVVGFFLRLNFLIQNQQVDEKMTVSLFGELFVWWWIVSFKEQLMNCDWDSESHIQELKDWIYGKTTDQQRIPWERRAIRDLENALEEANTTPLDM